MSGLDHIEMSLQRAVVRAAGSAAPPRIAAAIRHAVFPGGARVRPRLCHAVAQANCNAVPAAAIAAASAIELMHCASLVHDDMPIFDDADTRRGRPSVHAAFGQPIALLAGDALIVLAFETIARDAAESPAALTGLLMTLAQSTGMPSGIVAGQAWECEDEVDIRRYHRAKTGSLFVAATMMGAIAGQSNPEEWRALGERLGEAYQVADDLRDVAALPEEIGKPVAQDAGNGRCNAVAEFGLTAAVNRLKDLVESAVSAIPDCPGTASLTRLVQSEATRLMPAKLARQAA